MAALDHHRERTLERLSRHFTAGHVGPGTLEHRVEAAMRAQTVGGLRSATWDLPPLRHHLVDAVLARLAPPVPCTRLSIRAAEEAVLDLDAGPCTWVLGRSRSCDVTIKDPAVSRRHALVSVRGGRCSIRDLGSTNGLTVNGVPVRTAVLQPGDVVSLGHAVTCLVR